MNPRQGKPSVSPARRAAFDILRRVEREQAYASVLIAQLPESDLSREDRSLAQEITLGVLRHQKSLDYFIERYSRRAAGRLDLPVLITLRMGLYQLRHLTRIPQRAAVNESVNLVRLARAASAAGMVNAVLRNAARHADERPGEEIADPLERLSVAASHPRWLLERWVNSFSYEQALALALANNERPPTAFRVNAPRANADEALALIRSEGLTLRPSLLAQGAYVVESGPAAGLTAAAERGLVYIQDEASQMVSLLLDPKGGERILDLCAAPGSKSSHIAALAEGESWVVACDVRPQRLMALRATCRRLGIDSVDEAALDATEPLPFLESAIRFDRALIDAPCSGTGTLRRNPEIKWRLAPGDIARLVGVQSRLLERASGMVARGGRLVYSTCSVEREENEGVINRFLEGGAPYRLLRPNAGADVITAEGFVRTFPHLHGSDGFFAAVLEKTE
jgi:16S rRNA (cytosine967-C5)-methyltransferase